MKTLSKNQKQKDQKKQRTQNNKSNNRRNRWQSTSSSAHLEQQPLAAPADDLLGFTTQEAEIEAFYQKVAADEANRDRHAQELMNTPGLEHLTNEEALEKVEFMQRFAAWVFQQHCREQLEQEHTTAASNQKVTKSRVPAQSQILTA